MTTSGNKSTPPFRSTSPTLAELTDTMPCGLLLFNDDGVILDANTTLLEWVDATRATLIRERIERIFPPGGKIFYHTHFFPLLRSAGAVTEVYFALLGLSGRELPVLITAVRHTDVEPAVNLATFVVINNRQQFEGALLDAWKLEQAARDEMNRKSAELDQLNSELQARNDALEAAEDALMRSNAAKDEFIGMVSHELKNPLAVLSGTMNALAGRLGELSPEESQELLDGLHEEFSRLVVVVDSLLIVARSQLGRVELEPVLMQRTVAALVAEENASGQDAPVVLDIEPDLPAAIGSESFIEQIVGNFISNARKYGRPGSPIDIRVFRDEPCVNVTVSNDGDVLDEEAVEHFFEPFYRAEAHRHGTKGVGLGLTVCLRLAEAQDGEVSAKPRPGGGLEITLSLNELPADEE